MTRPIFGAMGLAIVALTLVACQPEHAEWRSQCATSHDETYPDVMYISDGRGGMTPWPTTSTRSVCDSYERVCVPGRDGSTQCGADPEVTPATAATSAL